MKDSDTQPVETIESGEPVAWVYDFRSSLNVGWKEEFSRLPPTQSEWVRNIVPLLPYAAPQPAQTAQSVATPISIRTEQIAEIAGKYNLENPRLDALRGFVNEIIIVNEAEYAKSE